MKININYLDNIINVSTAKITTLEIQNRKYFYRIVNDINSLINKNELENILIIEEETKKEVKPYLYINYFDFELENKKSTLEINKYVNKLVTEEERLAIIKEYNKILKIYNKKISLLDIPLKLNKDISIDEIIKLFKIQIDYKNDLLFNLILIIDFVKVFNYDKLLVFVNLKDYLSNEELIEFYKYIIYNQIHVLLIDVNKHIIFSKYENKYIIDENLDEYVL